MSNLFATVDPDGPIRIYNRENGDVIFSSLSESVDIPSVIEFLRANFGEHLKIYLKYHWSLYNKLPEEIQNAFEVVKPLNLVILRKTNLNTGDKFVYVKPEKKQTVFELYQVTKPKIAEKINQFCVSASLERHLTAYTDFDVILFALGIKEKEAYLVMYQTEGYAFGNIVEKFGDKFIEHFRANSVDFENYIHSCEFNPNFIKICQDGLVTIRKTVNLKVNRQQSFICPKPLQNYESKPNLMGIDLGTTHLCLAVSRNGRIEPIPIDNSGDLWIPSAIYFGEEPPIVGQVAVNRLQDEPDSVIFCPKTVPSAGFEFSSAYIQGSMVQYHTGEANFYIKSDGQIRQVSLTDVVALFMETMQKAASEHQSEFYKKNVMTQAVLTVPKWPSNCFKTTSTYDFLWLNAIIKAGMKLGIEILDIIPEIYADFLYYLSKYDVEKDKNVLVIDCGGGRTALQTYKIVSDDGHKRITHLASRCCDSWHYTADVFGGVHFDNLIIRKIDEVLENQKINPMETKKSRFKFFKAIQKIKHDITQEDQISVDLSELGSKVQKDFVLKEKDVDDIFRGEVVDLFVQKLSHWTKKQNFELIFLAGGTSRIPILQDSIKQMFPNAEIIMDGEVEVITATGAAIHGLQILNGEIEPFTEFQRFKSFEQKKEEKLINQ